MMDNKLLSLIVGLTVGVLLCVGLVAPVAMSATPIIADKEQHTNMDSAPYTENPESYTFTADLTGITVNGESITVPNYTQILASDHGVLYKIGDNVYTLYLMDAGVSAGITISDSVTLSLTLLNKELTVNYGTNTQSATVEYAYAYTGNGVYAEWSQPPFTTNPGKGGMITVGDGLYSRYKGYVLVEDWAKGSAVFKYRELSGGTLGEIQETVMNWTVTDNEDGSITVTNITDELNLFASGTHRTLYENDYYTYKDNTETKLVAVIPIMAFIALIGFAAFAVRGRMND